MFARAVKIKVSLRGIIYLMYDLKTNKTTKYIISRNLYSVNRSLSPFNFKISFVKSIHWFMLNSCARAFSDIPIRFRVSSRFFLKFITNFLLAKKNPVGNFLKKSPLFTGGPLLGGRGNLWGLLRSARND